MRIDVLEDGSLYRVWAPAKLNLFFEILGKRPDGYHEVETLVAPVNLYDRLDCRFFESDAPKITLECFDEDGGPCLDVPTDDSNLVAKAYYACSDEISEKCSCNKYLAAHVKIFKKIPTKAGLGGGSSDAAALLLVFKRLAGDVMSSSVLHETAARLGSDVPLFLVEGASIGRGRGERVEPFNLPELWSAIIKPSVGLSTSEVYRQYSTTPHSPKRSVNEVVKSIREYSGDNFGGFMGEQIFNRLEECASLLWDGVERWKSTLAAFPETFAVQMSGSGTAFFALCSNEDSANRVASAVRAESPIGSVEDVFVARTL